MGLNIRGIRVFDLWFPFQQFLHALEAHLAGLEGVECESQQCRWEDELLHIKDQGHQSSNAQTTGFELSLIHI